MTPHLTAGAGRAAINLDGILPREGFAVILDQLHVRILLLDDGQQRIGLGVVELTSLPAWAVTRLRSALAASAQVAEHHVVIGVSHTFSAPHLTPEEPRSGARTDPLFCAIESAITEAGRQAVSTSAPTTVSFGRGHCQVNVSRDVETSHGWWLGAGDGVTDDDVAVLTFSGEDGGSLATLACYAVQSSVLDGSRTAAGERLVSGDLLGAACTRVEAATGAPALALVGCAGDQSPTLTAVTQSVDPNGRVVTTDASGEGPELVRSQGELLGDAILLTARAAVALPSFALDLEREEYTVPGQVPPARREDLHPTRTYSFEPSSARNAPVVVLRVGTVAIVGVQPELNAVTGLAVKAASRETVVATMVDGAAKYMADAPSYDRITYEAMNSAHGRGAAEALAAAVVALVNDPA